MRHDLKVGDWLADAKQQFRTLDPDHERLWFLWCSMEARFGGENQGERTISVLYGVREAHDVEPPPPEVRRADHVAVLRDVQRATGLPYLNFIAIEVEYMQTGRIVLPTEE